MTPVALPLPSGAAAVANSALTGHQWLYAAHVGGFALATLGTLAFGYRVAHRNDGRAVTAFAALTVLVGGWGLFATLQLLAPGETWKTAMFLLSKPFAWGTGVAWLVFTLYFTGRGHWLTSGAWTALLGSYALGVALALTNPLHGLLWADFSVLAEPFPHLRPAATPLADFAVGLVYTFILVGFGVLVTTLSKSRRVSRVQIGLVLGSAVLAFALTSVDASPIVVVPTFEYGPIGSMVFFAAVSWGLFRHDLFVVGPLARDEVVETLSEGVIVTTPTGRIVDYNDAARRRLPELDGGFGQPLETLVPELVEQPDSVGVDRFTADLRRRTGTDERVYAVRASVLGSAAHPRGYALTLQDITAVTEYASQLERQNERLESFASVVSHDLRNPLNVAQGRLEMYQMTGDETNLSQAAAAHERMNTLIDDVLALARHGDIDDLAPVDVRQVATRSWQGVETGDATFTADGNLRILADEPRLRQLFENLFRNAVDHNPDRELHVRVLSIDGGFAVEDTGTGIPTEDLDLVFESGYSTADDGTGFGLAIVQQIADAHGWRIAATSGSEGGARFEITGVDVASSDAA